MVKLNAGRPSGNSTARGREDRHLILGRAGEHVDLAVSFDLDVELAQAVNHLVVMAVPLELASELAGIDPGEIIHAVRSRTPPTISATAGLAL
jgi:hypothetical protein